MTHDATDEGPAVRLTDWLSITAAVGLTSRQARSRSSISSTSWITGVANEFAKLSNISDLKASVGAAYVSMNTGLLDGASGKGAAKSDPIYTQFWSIGHDAFQRAAQKAMEDGLSMDDLTQEATAQAKKAVAAWPQKNAAGLAIQNAFFDRWVAENHGYGVFEGDAREAILAIYGIPNESADGPHMKKWAGASSLPNFLKT